RIFTKEIKENDIIRLGPDGANGFVFMAHRVVAPDDSYAYEFRQLRRQARGQLEKEKKKEKKIEINGWISKVSGLAAMGLCSLAGSVAGLSVSPNTRYMLIACAPVLVGLIFSGDAKALKELRKKREKLFLCPKCGKPLAEFDIEQGQCSRCKAK
ncbi:MAG: hypothetical protein K2G69_02170, partial [Muribaculaceae bacterium]|nr:hypothetical protein [Muribaculaceae bacterium]